MTCHYPHCVSNTWIAFRIIFEIQIQRRILTTSYHGRVETRLRFVHCFKYLVIKWIEKCLIHHQNYDWLTVLHDRNSAPCRAPRGPGARKTSADCRITETDPRTNGVSGEPTGGDAVPTRVVYHQIAAIFVLCGTIAVLSASKLLHLTIIRRIKHIR